jgi:hypothetical protein
VSPCLGAVLPQLNHNIVAFLWRASRGAGQVRRGQPVEDRIRLQSPEITEVFARQIVQCFTVGVARIDTEVGSIAQALSLGNHLLHEPQHALGRMHLPLPQNGVQEAVAQATPVVHAVVVAGHGVVGDQRMIDGVFVVTVVCRAGLLAVNGDGETVDVDRDLAGGVVSARGA